MLRKIKHSLSPTEKLDMLGQAARHDLSCACGDSTHRIKSDFSRWIYPAVLPSGGTVRMLKILLSNDCKNNCSYCANRVSVNVQRISFKPLELAEIFMKLYLQGQVSALFLSSAVVGSADETMERMIRAVEIVRFNYKFKGFIHLKILPSTSFHLIQRSVAIANRVSVNLECPNERALGKIAPDKDFDMDLLEPIRKIHDIIQNLYGKKRDQTTQFVVGAADETDQDILSQVCTLYKKLKITRTYYSAYEPPDDEPWGRITPAPLVREHRLYQADFLLRKYGFLYDEIEFDNSGNLSLDEDPKKVWARKHQDLFPIEITSASAWQLLRVPGIGPVTTKKIITNRKQTVFRNEHDLTHIGIPLSKAGQYITLHGKKLSFLNSQNINQLTFEL